MTNKLREIYLKMGDELSRQLYLLRLDYSISGSKSYIDNLCDVSIRVNKAWKSLLDGIRKSSEDVVLFGNGIWGKTLQHELKNFRWKAIIDNSLAHKGDDTMVISAIDFLSNYQGERIVISSYKYRDEMIEQCLNAGVSQTDIIDASTIIYGLTEGKIYFDEDIPMHLQPGLFIDGGCYDGSDTVRFLEKYKGRVLCFEPDTGNVEKIRKKLSSIAAGKYRIVSKALWSTDGEVAFVDGENLGSHISSNDRSKIKIKTATIDVETGTNQISMIKMDIEGAELEALNGARKVIERDHPILAISIYHKPEDIVVIPEYILNLYGGYQLYLRHYSFTWYDTVLYALPEER